MNDLFLYKEPLFSIENKILNPITDISKVLSDNKSTVFNIIYTLEDLGIVEHGPDNKFRFGSELYALGKAAGGASGLIQVVRPYLKKISGKTKVSAFLGICSQLRAVIVDKVDSPIDIMVSSETGMRIPLLAGAGGKVLLSFPMGRSTKFLRQQHFAIDDEEYIEGIRGLAVPLRLDRGHLNAAIWIVGLKSQIKDEVIPLYRSILKEIAQKIETRFSLE